jgi:N-acetylneuraminic acid mutarotase
MKRLLLIPIIFFAVACDKDDNKISGPSFTVTSFSPAQGYAGDEIVIRGTDFTLATIVRFGAATAELSGITATRITAIVPKEATSGFITVEIDGESINTSDSFTFLSPQISSFEPSTALEGETIIINGTHFNADPEKNLVTFSGDKKATVSAATTTQLTVVVPSGATSGVIKIDVDGEVITSSVSFTVKTIEVIDGRWILRAELPGGTRDFGAVFFSVGSKIYYGLGYSYQDPYTFYDFWELSIETYQWTKKKDFTPVWSTQRSLNHSATFVIDNQAYILADSAIWLYNTGNDSWTKRNYFADEKHRDGPVSFVIGSKGYYGMGGDRSNATISTVYKDIWEYDPINDEWTRKADYDGGAHMYGAAFTIGDNGYVGGGYEPGGDGFEGTRDDKDFYEFAPTENTWTRKTMPFAFGGFGDKGGFEVGDFGYFGDTNKSFYKYDPGEDNWTTIDSFSGDGYLFFAIKVGDRVFVRTSTQLWEMKVD